MWYCKCKQKNGESAPMREKNRFTENNSLMKGIAADRPNHQFIKAKAQVSRHDCKDFHR